MNALFSWPVIANAIAFAVDNYGRSSPSGSAMRESLPVTNRADQMRALMRRRLPHGLAITAANAGSNYLLASPTLGDLSTLQIAGWLFVMTADFVLGITLIIGGLTAAQVWIQSPARRYVMMAVALPISSSAGAAFGSSVAWHSLFVGELVGGTWGGTGLFLHLLWMSLTAGTLLAVFYEWQQRSERTSAALAEARLSAEQLERTTLQSRLNGMKARVDPEFLFAVITKVEALYQHDLAAAERLLEQLIVFLRTSMPRTADSATTIEQELQLVESYLQIEHQLRGANVSYRVLHDEASPSSRFAPSVLLPLISALLPKMPTTALHLYVRAEQHANINRIEIERRAPMAAPSVESIEAARISVRAIFGDAAAVSVVADSYAHHRILIEVPRECCEREEAR